MSIQVKRYFAGPIDTNCYLIIDQATGKAAILDPGGISNALDEAIRTIGAEKFEYILLTHGHFDHIGAAVYYKNLTAARIVINEKDADFTQNDNLNLSAMFSGTSVQPFKADCILQDGGTVMLGETQIKLLHTPGHTCGSCCYIIDNTIFSGDTLMRLSMGRTDFATGNNEEIKASLSKIAQLDGDYHIYPGHGEDTTLQYERENNPYLGMVEYDNIY